MTPPPDASHTHWSYGGQLFRRWWQPALQPPSTSVQGDKIAVWPVPPDPLHVLIPAQRRAGTDSHPLKPISMRLKLCGKCENCSRENASSSCPGRNPPILIMGGGWWEIAKLKCVCASYPFPPRTVLAKEGCRQRLPNNTFENSKRQLPFNGSGTANRAVSQEPLRPDRQHNMADFCSNCRFRRWAQVKNWASSHSVPVSSLPTPGQHPEQTRWGMEGAEVQSQEPTIQHGK